MQRQPAQLEIPALPQRPYVEAAARRRMRGVEGAYPAVQGWNVRIETPQAPEDVAARFAAHVQASIIGGDTLRGEGSGNDALAALRLAFNALESELEAEHEHARARAADWLSTVKRRLGQLPLGS